MREMKDSENQWFVQIPKKWEIVRFKQVAKAYSNLVDPNDYLSYVEIDPDSIEKDSGRIINLPTVEEAGVISTKNLFHKGQILYSKIRPTLNKVTIAPCDGLCSSDMCPIETSQNTRWLKYVMLSDSFVSQVYLYSSGVKMPRINVEQLNQIRIALSPSSVQMLIANYLDARCAEIDSLTADIKEQIDVLEQYKKSVITEAVTKGLDPNVEMKDSKVKWIGKIPEGWTISHVKYVAQFENGDRGDNYPSGNDIVDDGIIFLTSKNIHGTEVDISKNISKYISKEKYASLRGAKVKVNDIIYCLRGSVGQCAINLQLTEGTIASSLLSIVPLKCVAKYLNYCLKSSIADYQIHLYLNGSCAANLSAENVANFIFLEPPIAEQYCIANYLDARCAEIDEIISTKQDQLETLSEYKKSLIYEYVTGKKEVPTN